MGLEYLGLSIVKIIGLIAYLYGLFWVLDRKSIWVKIAGVLVAFGIIQFALIFKIGGTLILNGFDQGLLYQAVAMTIVSLGLNLIYGFNGQFSLGQWGFYGIGAYAAADITYRWVNGDAAGLIVVLIGVLVEALLIYELGVLLKRLHGMPILSQFTLYLIGTIVVWALAVFIGNPLGKVLDPLLLNGSTTGPLAQGIPLQIVFLLAVLCAGGVAAEIGFLFGLPVLTLGSDYFGIATLGFTIVVNVLLVNSDTILPFPEMRGGRGMIGIPKLTTWFWAFSIMLAVIIVMRNLIYSSTGRTIMAVRDDETAARAMGVDLAQTKLNAFMIGSLFAGIGGGIYAHYIGFLSPANFDFLQGFNPLIIVVFGGLGSMTGTVTASFGWIFFLEGLLRVLLGQLGTDAPTWRFVLYPITLLLLMLIRPQGLLGTSEWGFLKPPKILKRIHAETTPQAQVEPNQGAD